MNLCYCNNTGPRPRKFLVGSFHDRNWVVCCFSWLTWWPLGLCWKPCYYSGHVTVFESLPEIFSWLKWVFLGSRKSTDFKFFRFDRNGFWVGYKWIRRGGSSFWTFSKEKNGQLFKKKNAFGVNRWRTVFIGAWLPFKIEEYTIYWWLVLYLRLFWGFFLSGRLSRRKKFLERLESFWKNFKNSLVLYEFQSKLQKNGGFFVEKI